MPRKPKLTDAEQAQADLDAIVSGPQPPSGSWDYRPDWKRAQIRRKAKELIRSGKWAKLPETQKRLYELGGQFSASRDEDLIAQKQFMKRMKGK